MKIVHVITRLILGGAQENTILTCEGLARAGHDVTLITGPAIGPEGELFSRAEKGEYRLEVIDELRREIHPLRDAKAGNKLAALLTSLRPDIVHTHSSKAGVIGRKVAAKLRRTRPGLANMKIVHTIHGLPYHRYEHFLRNRVYIALERAAAKRSDAMISVADAMTAQALAAGVGRPEQYATIRSGMETEAFLTPTPQAAAFREELGLSDEDILVTQVSRLAELKGHERILQAAQAVSNPKVHFCFVGDGHLRPEIELAVANMPIPMMRDRFHLTGLLPPERIPAVMQATDILVHCSFREGLARTLPQAMLAGKPVVAYDVDGAREVVDETTGVLLPAGEVQGLAEAINRLADDAELRENLGAAGRQRCRHDFDHRVMVEQIDNLYRKLFLK